MSDSQSYKYPSSLGLDDLRLLQPTFVSPNTLSFRIVKVTRATKCRYTALSYTWGDDEASEHIRLDGKTFRVRPNLWGALYVLAIHAKQAAWQYIWVDAICIDQGSQAERTAQVKRMDQTYSDAVCVSVWLGQVSPPEDLNIQWPRGQAIRTVETDVLDWEDELADLANRPYWSRFWVVQEFLLGRDVEIHCSNHRINWLDFQDILCDAAEVSQFHDEPDDMLMSQAVRSYAALPLVKGRHPDKHPELHQPFRVLVETHHRANCKDPRDRVFALLGLISPDERRALARFFPDYSLSIDDVHLLSLAHLMQYSPLGHLPSGFERITSASDNVFRGLGVEAMDDRKKLLRRAELVDYIGLLEMSKAEVLSILAMHNDDDQCMASNIAEIHDFERLIPISSAIGLPQPRRQRPRRLKSLIITVIIVVGIVGLHMLPWST